VRGLKQAVGWICDERDAAEARLLDVHDLLDRLDQSGQDFTTDTIRAVLGARGRPWAEREESADVHRP
jgi:hypothetical protein